MATPCTTDPCPITSSVSPAASGRDGFWAHAALLCPGGAELFFASATTADQAHEMALDKARTAYAIRVAIEGAD